MLSLSLLLIILVCPALANAATLTSVDISQTVQTEDALFIFFDVADETGEPLSGISSEDVIISIGRKDYVPSVQTMAKSELGIGYVFAVDISKSLSEEQFEGVREAIVSWIDGMGEMDQAAILTLEMRSPCCRILLRIRRHCSPLRKASHLRTAIHNCIMVFSEGWM